MAASLFQQISLPSKHAWIVGDIHGQYELLIKALQQKGFDPNAGDQLFSVGDLIDRGPDSLKVLELLNKPWFFAVMGNHEQLLLKGLSAMEGEGNITDILNWQTFNGGDWYKPKSDMALKVAAMLHKVATLPMAIELVTESGRVGIIHAAVPENVWLDTNTLSHPDAQKHCLWYRENGLQARATEQLPQQPIHRHLHQVVGIDKVVVGHTIMNTGKPVLLGNTLYLDVGAANGQAPAVISAKEVLALNQQGSIAV